MLCQHAPGEWKDHRQKLVERPKSDQFRIIEMCGDCVSIHEQRHPQLFP
jgi:hypothetical protein